LARRIQSYALLDKRAAFGTCNVRHAVPEENREFPHYRQKNHAILFDRYDQGLSGGG